MTNLDRIRAMTEDELIAWFCRGRWCVECPYYRNNNCCLREWLREEADDET